MRVTPGRQPRHPPAISTGGPTRSSASTSTTRRAAIERAARPPTGSTSQGLHMHIGSQLLDLDAVPRARSRRSPTLGDFRDLRPRRRPRRRLHRRRPARRRSRTTSPAKVDAVARARSGPGKRLLDRAGRALVANAGVTLYTVERSSATSSTWVAVDGGMSDNLRPMLYGARYEAHVADRVGAAATPCHRRRQALRVRRRDRPRRARCADPRPGDVLVTPGDRRLRLRDGQQLQRRPARRRSSSAATATRASSCAARPTRTCIAPRRLSAFRIGLLGHGTVGARVRGAARRARRRRSSAITGLRPGAHRRAHALARATSTRSSPARDLIVELMGGIEPGARATCCARCAPASTSSPPTSSCSRQHGEELWACAREHGVQLRFEARGRRRRAGHPRAAGVARRRARRAHPRDRQRHDELHPHRDGAHRRLLRRGARRGAASSATPRPTRPTTSTAGRRGEDGDPRAARVRHAGAPRPGRLRGHRAHHRRRHGVRARARPRR